MVRHFFRLLIQRNFKRNSFHSLINILGLSIGLTAFILFILFIHEIKDYDTFHEKYNSLYRIIKQTNDSRGDFCGTPALLGAYISDRVPEIDNYTRVEERKNITVTIDQKKFFESDLLFVDNSFFEMFSFPIVQGNKEKPIENINSLILSESMAEKYFGDTDPIGKVIKLGRKEKDYQITAVVQDCPKNSSIKYNFITSFEVFDKNPYWGEFNYYTYVQVNQNVKGAEEKIQSCIVDREGDIMPLSFLRLQALKDLRFEKVRGNTFNTIDRKYVLIFLFSSVFILLLAVINYTNLASAMSLKRSKEVAIKKILGSHKKRIVFEFLIESVFFSVIALLLSFILVELTGPIFGKLINEDITLSYSYVPLFLLIAIIVGFLAGVYPSIYGSRYNLLALLKQSIYRGKKAKLFRNLLVMVQFGITCFLLICAITFSKQIDFISNSDIGLDAENVIEVQVHWDGIKLNELKEELKSFASVENVTTSTFTAGEEGWNQTAYWEGMDDERQINMFVMEADKDFASTLGIHYLEKVQSLNDLSYKEQEYYIINESAKKYIGWNECINKSFSILSSRTGMVAGVVSDFNFRSLHHKTSPSVILLTNSPVSDKMHIKVQPEHKLEVITFLEKKWKELAPAGAPLIVTDLKQEFDNLYNTEKKTKTVIILFTNVAILISMLGLLGLATFITIQRTKEIGIRKTNGASTSNIISMLVYEFTKWVLLALLIIMPLAYLYLKKWLQNFSYQTELSWWIFVLAGFLTMIIAFLSVIIQSYRASLKNPVESLRYE